MSVVTAVLVALAPVAAQAAVPSTVFMKYAIPVPVNQVRIAWYGSTDASGHAITYDVYRHTLPITQANVAGLTPFLSVTNTIVTVPATAAETTQSYVWWYSVRARETTGVLKSVMANNYYAYAPNPHAMYPWGTSFICYNCHNMHGSGAGGLCYSCHGRADASRTASYADRSTLHVQSRFYDYPGQVPGSRHRNTAMTVIDPQLGESRVCSACHYAHLSPYRYTSSTAVSLTASYKRLLAVQTDAAGNLTAYARLSGSRKNQFCFACHGSGASRVMGYAGGASAYGASGGDHNQSGFDTDTAHGTPVVKSNDEPATNPAIQCLACHNKHASPTTALIDYRASDTTDPLRFGGAGLCFTCHSASSAETRTASGFAAPFAWNDRDVKREFARSSYHPFSTTDTSRGSLRCTNCHNTHYVKRTTGGSVDPATRGSVWDIARVSDPDNTKLAMADSTEFCLRCHDAGAPQAQESTDVVVPFTPSFTSVVASYFPGWDKTLSGLQFASSGHYSTPGEKALCANCHDPHASDFARLTAWTAPADAPAAGTWSAATGTRANTQTATSREQSLCYQCHGNGTTVGARANGAKDVATKTNATYAHDPGDTTGLHTDTETASGLAYAATGSKRHAECTDCHDPHVARRAGTTATHTTRESTAGAALYGAWGVDPNYGTHSDSSNFATLGASNFSAIRLTQSSTSYEAWLCFKCHSANTTINTATYTDQAREFNPSNFSEHNVLGQSTGVENAFTVGGVTYTWLNAPSANYLLTGWTTNSKMTCTDCHDGVAASDGSNIAAGPHGSSVQWILDPDYVNWTNTTALVTAGNGMSPSNIICAKCHTGLGSSNTVHAKHAGGGAGKGLCRECHIRVPHGWKRPRMLGYTTDAAPYATITNGLRKVKLDNRAYNATADGGTCSALCNNNHKDLATYWP